jgi:putative colanic acid biosynthesis acetyltransferase WcaF
MAKALAYLFWSEARQTCSHTWFNKNLGTWNLRIGNYVGIGEHVNIYCMDSINIGNYSVVSQGSHLCAGSHDFYTPNLQLITAPIVIGSRVWICAESFI